MLHASRIVSLLVVLTIFLRINSYSQLIEKAPPTPVTVNPVLADSLTESVTISGIAISGNKKTRPYIIQREIPFVKGEIVSSRDLKDKLSLCKQRLMNTALFVDVDIKPRIIDSSHIAVGIVVKERWYLFPLPYFQIVTRNFNTWWVQENHSFQRVNYGLKFMQNNVTGRNDNLNVWIIGGYTQQMSVRYENPSLDKKLKHGFNIGFGYSRNRELNYAIDFNRQSFYKNENEFIIKNSRADISYTYRPAIKTRHTFRVSYHDMSVSDSVILKNPRFFAAPVNRVKYADINYNLNYFNLDYNPYPLKGVAADMNLYKRFGKTTNVWEVSGTGNYIVKVLPISYLQLQAAGLIRLPFNQPYISNSLMGSTNLYMRGLEYYVVEGSAGGVARATLKNRVLSFNVRSPIKSRTHDKIPIRIFLKTYADVGYSYTPNVRNSMLNNKLLRTWGTGVDIVTFYDVVVKLEWSFNQLGENGLFVHTQTDF
ncbi:MAG: hypothetical protein JWQ40_1452 [Segetibacter sp.]|nr:hypothetical protein [Segetibacter sp.]